MTPNPNVKKKVKIAISIDEKLLQEMDNLKNFRGISRSRLIAELVSETSVPSLVLPNSKEYIRLIKTNEDIELALSIIGGDNQRTILTLLEALEEGRKIDQLAAHNLIVQLRKTQDDLRNLQTSIDNISYPLLRAFGVRAKKANC